MEFREWADNNQEINSFLIAVSYYILKNIKVGPDGVHIQFPPMYSQFVKEEQPYMALAAHQVNIGNLIPEIYDKFKYGKGEVAFKTIVNSPFAKSLTPRQAFDFKRGIKSNLKDIARKMGLAFELELFIFLIAKKGLISTKSINWAKTELENKYQEISMKTGGTGLAKMLEGFIAHHAAELAEQMYKKACELLKCTIKQVEFKGGNPSIGDVSFVGFRSTSDMVLQCGSRKIGFSTKFASEADIKLGDFFFAQAYAILGGKKPKAFKKQLEQSVDQKEFLIEQYYQLAQSLTDKQKLDFLINMLLFGTETSGNKEVISHVLPAIRNYVNGRGGVEFSPAIQRQFDISYKPGMKLKIKKEAEVIVRRTGAGVHISINTPNSRATYIRFDVDFDKVVVRMNNLMSE